MLLNVLIKSLHGPCVFVSIAAPWNVIRMDDEKRKAFPKYPEDCFFVRNLRGRLPAAGHICRTAKQMPMPHVGHVASR